MQARRPRYLKPPAVMTGPSAGDDVRRFRPGAPVPGPTPLIIEFVGLPGAGKSHATRVLCSRLADHDIVARSTMLRIDHEMGQIRRVLVKSWLALKQSVSRPGEAWAAIRVIHSTGQTPAETLSLWINWMTRASIIATARKHGSVEVFDEGVVQLQWSLRLKARNQPYPSLTSVGGLESTYVVVVVSETYEAIRSRIEARRARSRFDTLRPEELGGWFIWGSRLLSDLVVELKDLARKKSAALNLLLVEADSGLNSTVEEALELVVRVVTAAGGG